MGFDEHYIGSLCVSVSFDGERAWGSAPVLPQAFAPGSTTIRTGILATYVDIVGGHVPSGALGPTVDLRVQVVAPPPTDGTVRLEGRVLRVGGRLVVAETALHSGDDPRPFALAVSTFRNHHLGMVLPEPRSARPAMAEASFDELLAVSVRDERTLELTPTPRLANGVQGTVQGGVQALFAEMAAEHAVSAGRAMTARDLDIRYLDRLGNGPLVAAVDLSPEQDGCVPARVRLTDGADGHLVSFVSVTMHPAAEREGGASGRRATPRRRGDTREQRRRRR